MKYVCFDFETTGVDPIDDTPIQICAIAYDSKFQEIDRMKYYVWNGVPLKPIITQITGITTEFLKEHGITPEAGTKRWQKFIWDHYPACLVGYNIITFDYPMSVNWLRNNSKEKFKYPPIHEMKDVLRAASRHFGTKKWPKLKDAATRLGLTFEEGKLHDAEADVQLTMDVWTTILTKQSAPVTTP